MGRMFGESGPSVTDEELEQDAQAHERVEEAASHHTSWWRRLFRRSTRSER